MIKTLIVDDNREKAVRISNIIRDSDPLTCFEIDIAGYSNQAKDYIRRNKYDLLIIDIVIPSIADGNALINEGINLLESVIGSPEKYHIPSCIIGTSFNKDISDSAKKHFNTRLNAFIPYSEDSDEFSSTLSERVRQLIFSLKKQDSSEQFKSFCCVICALDQEFQALLSNGWKWDKGYDELQNEYYISTIGGLSDKKIIAAKAPRMGMLHTGITAMRMTTLYAPRYLAMIGIAASLSKNTNYGDILISNPIWDWSIGKLISDGTGFFLQSEPYQLSLDTALQNQLSRFSKDTAVLQSIYAQWPADKPRTVLTAHMGPMASGPAVVATKAVASMLFSQHRKILGLDMESYAIFEIAKNVIPPSPHPFSMKSVVDFADERKDDTYHKYACYTAAQGFKKFVEGYLS